MLISIATGACVGAIAELFGFAFGAAVVMCILATGVVEITAAYRYLEPDRRSRRAFEVFPLRRGLIPSAFSAAVLVLLLLLHVPRMGALVFQRTLSKLVVPDAKIPSIPPANLQARLRRTSTIIDNGFLSGTPLDPTSLIPVEQFIRAALREDMPSPLRTEALSTLIKVHGYEMYSAGALGIKADFYLINVTIERFGTALSIGSEFAERFGTTAVQLQPELFGNVVVYNSKLVDIGSQSLDGVTWIDTQFSHVRVTYSGSDVYLANITFKDCTFEFGDSPQGRALLKRLQDAQSKQMPATILFTKQDERLTNLYSPF